MGVDESSEIAHARMHVCLWKCMLGPLFTHVNYYCFLILKNYWRQYKGDCSALTL